MHVYRVQLATGEHFNLLAEDHGQIGRHYDNVVGVSNVCSDVRFLPGTQESETSPEVKTRKPKRNAKEA